MKWYLKRYPDGHEYTPCRDDAPPREGYEIVERIPDDIHEAERETERQANIRAASRDALAEALEADEPLEQAWERARAKVREIKRK